MSSRGSVWVAMVALALVADTAQAKLSRTGGAHVAAHATATAGLKIDATTSELRVNESAGRLTLTVPLATLKTGIGLRDRHMREKYLAVDKYPNVEVVVARGQLKFPAEGQEATGEAAATMTLHGQTKPVTLRYGAKRTSDTYAVRGATSINITDFGIKQPSYLGVSVNPTVSIEVRFQATDK